MGLTIHEKINAKHNAPIFWGGRFGVSRNDRPDFIIRNNYRHPYEQMYHPQRAIDPKMWKQKTSKEPRGTRNPDWDLTRHYPKAKKR